jgi:hypothetical protein
VIVSLPARWSIQLALMILIVSVWVTRKRILELFLFRLFQKCISIFSINPFNKTKLPIEAAYI